MIIIKIKDDVCDTQSFFRRFLLNKNTGISRDYVVVGGIPFDIISLSREDLECDEMQRLLKINRGRVMESPDGEINEIIKEYLFDKKPYIKRSLLSSVNKFIEQTGERLSVVISDENFMPCEEYFVLANLIKNFTLVSAGVPSVGAFAEKIYYDYGLKVSLKRNAEYSNYDIAFDFSWLKKDGELQVFYRGESEVVRPDNKYFEPDNDVLTLMEYGVSVKCACAVLRDNNYIA